MTNNIATFLWFDSSAEQAARLYCSIFPSAKLGKCTPMGASFEIDGQWS